MARKCKKLKNGNYTCVVFIGKDPCEKRLDRIRTEDVQAVLNTLRLEHTVNFTCNICNLK